jgi:GNAT superfamily N-acetyltransferase
VLGAVRTAVDQDFDAFLALAAEVEGLFGPMVDEPGFHDALRKNIARGSALVIDDGAGALLFSPHRCSIGWLVVAPAAQSRGLGQALLAEAFRRWVRPPCAVEVVTFGEDHPGAQSRSFYERLGFAPGGRVPDGPEGGPRQVFRLELESLPEWAG